MVIAAVMLVAGTALRMVWTFESMGPWFAVVRLFSFGLTSTSLVMACIAANEGNGWGARWMRSSPLRFIGRISHGVYLYHFVIYHWTGLSGGEVVDLRQLPVIWMITRAVGLTFLVATVSFYVIERPCLKPARGARVTAVSAQTSTMTQISVINAMLTIGANSNRAVPLVVSLP